MKASDVAERIVQLIREGKKPWMKPWTTVPPVSWVSRRRYQGVNFLLLEPGEYITALAAEKQGGRVRPGSPGSNVVFFTIVEDDDKKDEKKEKKYPVFRVFQVYRVGEEIEGIPPRYGRDDGCQLSLFDDLRTRETEERLLAYARSAGVEIVHSTGDRAFWECGRNRIVIPYPNRFPTRDDYLYVLGHEIVHSTAVRLGRKLAQKEDERKTYAFEELVAEIGASILAVELGLHPEMTGLEQSASYVESWLFWLERDARNIFRAAGLAEKAVRMIVKYPTPKGMGLAGVAVLPAAKLQGGHRPRKTSLGPSNRTRRRCSGGV